MKSKEEITLILFNELIAHLNAFTSEYEKQDYYNSKLGSTSYLLARLLDKNLNEDEYWAKNGCWVDDCLISNIYKEKKTLKLSGLMIWGKGGTTQQWADPFRFEVELIFEEKLFKSYTFYFGDEDEPIKIYSNYRHKRDLWNDFKGNWNYIITNLPF